MLPWTVIGGRLVLEWALGHIAWHRSPKLKSIGLHLEMGRILVYRRNDTNTVKKALLFRRHLVTGLFWNGLWDSVL